jgi:hypothetical protein
MSAQAAARALGNMLSHELVAVVASFLNGFIDSTELLLAEALLPFAKGVHLVVTRAVYKRLKFECYRLVNGLPHSDGDEPSYFQADLDSRRCDLCPGMKLVIKWNHMGGPCLYGRPLFLCFSSGCLAYFSATFPSGCTINEREEEGQFVRVHSKCGEITVCRSDCFKFNSKCNVCSGVECQFVAWVIQVLYGREGWESTMHGNEQPKMADYTIEWFGTLFAGSAKFFAQAQSSLRPH